MPLPHHVPLSHRSQLNLASKMENLWSVNSLARTAELHTGASSAPTFGCIHFMQLHFTFTICLTQNVGSQNWFCFVAFERVLQEYYFQRIDVKKKCNGVNDLTENLNSFLCFSFQLFDVQLWTWTGSNGVRRTTPLKDKESNVK